MTTAVVYVFTVIMSGGTTEKYILVKETAMNQLSIIDYKDNHVLKVLKHTVAKGATDAEFALFVEYCKSTKLNPFKKEIWFIKAGDRLQLMTGINGYWTIANDHPAFDGAEGGFIDKDGNWTKSVPGNDFIGAWCRVYRKDRKYPMEGEAMMADYNSGVGLWKHKPRIMIKKVAESIALRKAFAQELGGLYTAEEMPATYANKAVVTEDIVFEKVDEKTGEVLEKKYPETLEEDDIPWAPRKDK